MASIFDVFNMMQQGGGTEAGTGNQAMPQMGVYPQGGQDLGMWRNIDPQQMMQMGQGMMQQPQQQPSPLPFAGGPVNVGGGAYSQQFNDLQTPMQQGGVQGYQPQTQSVAKQNEIEQLRQQMNQLRGGLTRQQADQRYQRNWHMPGR